MHILFIIPSLGNGGAEKHAQRLANELADRGHKLDIAVFRDGGSYQKEVKPSVEIHTLQSRFRSSTAAALNSIPCLRKLLLERHYDIAVSFVAVAVAITHIALPRKSKTLHFPCIQNHYGSELANGSLIERILIFPVALRGFSKAAHTISLSQGVLRDLLERTQRDPSTATVIHNIGHDSSILNLASAPIDRSASNSTQLVACGRLREQKDYPTLLKALSLCKSEVSLWILGTGPLKEKLISLAAELGVANRVSFLGFKDNPFAYIAKADIFVLSSGWEGFGNVIVEAIACGTAVISTDCPHGPAEILDNGTYGMLVPPGNANVLAQAIDELANDPRRRQAYSEVATKRLEAFSPATIANAYLNTFRAVLKPEQRLSISTPETISHQ